MNYGGEELPSIVSIYEKGDKKTTVDCKAGDIVITFYEKEFPNPVIVVNNEQWEENINTYETNEQKRKEEWAAKQKECCECCENCKLSNDY